VANTDTSNWTENELLRVLSQQYPTAESAIAELAALRAELQLPAANIHVVSDVHGEFKKLRHIINNASGRLRPLVEKIFAGKLNADQQHELLNLLYYPAEQIRFLGPKLADKIFRRDWMRATLRNQFRIVRELAADYPPSHVYSFFSAEYRQLFGALLTEPILCRDENYVNQVLDTWLEQDGITGIIRAAAHVVRNLTYAELIVAGDLGDRGPRLDGVIDYLRQQPNVSIVWGNHDAEWMGACLGQPALIASVLRFSTRYNRLTQLEEGYGIPLEPLEKLAREQYGDDPCEEFKVVGADLRDAMLVRRMQKAAAILQFKYEAAAIARNPQWKMDHRVLLNHVDFAKGTVEIDGREYAILDEHFPTIDLKNPLAISPAEAECMEHISRAFTSSPRLWEHMKWTVDQGAMWCRRGNMLIFHACVAVDEKGNPLSLPIDGKEMSGREQMDGVERIIRRAFAAGAEKVAEKDADWFWYLWAGPISPLFGKDKMATFEGYFVADEKARDEQKNPYFQFIHDADFCRKIGRDFGMDDDVLIVNGHVPVRIEKGENPVKRGGNAVTIDGAFSEAYGDHGYTLFSDCNGISLAEHAHFESIEDVIEHGADMVPKIKTIRNYDPPRKRVDDENADNAGDKMRALEALLTAYQTGGKLR
jgi:fructose-1,6-bisphosphatase-3